MLLRMLCSSLPQAHGAPIMAGMFGSVGGFVHPRILEEWRRAGDVEQHYAAGERGGRSSRSSNAGWGAARGMVMQGCHARPAPSLACAWLPSHRSCR